MINMSASKSMFLDYLLFSSIFLGFSILLVTTCLLRGGGGGAIYNGNIMLYQKPIRVETCNGPLCAGKQASEYSIC